MADPRTVCGKCGGRMEQGSLQISGAAGEFLIPGTKTSINPITAFQQGMSGEPGDRVFPWSTILGYRCSQCGYLEMYAPAV